MKKLFCDHCGKKLKYGPWEEVPHGFDPYTGEKNRSTYTRKIKCPAYDKSIEHSYFGSAHYIGPEYSNTQPEDWFPSREKL